MTKTYYYEGVEVDLATRRELARLEGKVAEAEGWVRHYTAEMAILADRAIRLEEITDVGGVAVKRGGLLAAAEVRRRREMKCARDDWRTTAENAKTQIRMLLAG